MKMNVIFNFIQEICGTGSVTPKAQRSEVRGAARWVRLGLTGSLVLLVMLVVAAGSADAKVFYSRSEALELAFPKADRVEDHTYILSDAQVARIEILARSTLPTRLVKLYTGWKGDRVTGYAFIDLHTVRTQTEAFLVVLSPEGVLRRLRVLAFHEPVDYLPNARWYAQFDHKTLGDPLRVGGDIHGIVGATLSARAATRGVRRALAFYEVLVEKGK